MLENHETESLERYEVDGVKVNAAIGHDTLSASRRPRRVYEPRVSWPAASDLDSPRERLNGDANIVLTSKIRRIVYQNGFAAKVHVSTFNVDCPACVLIR